MDHLGSGSPDQSDEETKDDLKKAERVPNYNSSGGRMMPYCSAISGRAVIVVLLVDVRLL